MNIELIIVDCLVSFLLGGFVVMFITETKIINKARVNSRPHKVNRHQASTKLVKGLASKNDGIKTAIL